MNIPKVGTKVRVNAKVKHIWKKGFAILDVGQTGVVSQVFLSVGYVVGSAGFTFNVKWDDGSLAHTVGWDETKWDCLDVGDEIPATLRSNQARDCACGIFRGDCTYHKD